MKGNTNVIANAAAQTYATALNIVFVPKYVEIMGPEAYGLVGIFALLQAWFSVLDFGFSPTVARETARFRGGAVSALHLLRVFRGLHLVFLPVVAVGGTLVFLSVDVISAKWLRADSMPPGDVQFCLRLMITSIALRCIGSLWRGVASGSERFLFLASFDASIATIRFVGVFVAMTAFGGSPRVFFAFQLLVVLLELSGLVWKVLGLLPRPDSHAVVGWALKPVRTVCRFSLALTFSSTVWIFVTQSDKLVLSGVLTLSQYGYFSIAVLASGGVSMACTPVVTVLLPRLTRLHALGDSAAVVALYRRAAIVICCVAFPIGLTMAVCDQSLLFAWTGNQETARNVAPILRLYAVGNCFLALGAFPYYLQYATGNLKWHMVGSAILFACLMPSVWFGARRVGAIGAGWAWAGINALYFFGYVGYVHGKLRAGLHKLWLRDIVTVGFPIIVVAFCIAVVIPDPQGRLPAIVATSVVGSALFATAFIIARRYVPLVR